MSSTTAPIVINGETIEVNDQATPAQNVETALFKKEDREGMGAEKRQNSLPRLQLLPQPNSTFCLPTLRT